MEEDLFLEEEKEENEDYDEWEDFEEPVYDDPD